MLQSTPFNVSALPCQQLATDKLSDLLWFAVLLTLKVCVWVVTKARPRALEKGRQLICSLLCKSSADFCPKGGSVGHFLAAKRLPLH